MRNGQLSRHERKSAIATVASLSSTLEALVLGSKPRGRRAGQRVTRSKQPSADGAEAAHRANPAPGAPDGAAAAAVPASARVPPVAAGPGQLALAAAEDGGARAKRPREGLVDERFPAIP